MNRRFVAFLKLAPEPFAQAALGHCAHTIEDGRFALTYTGPEPHRSESSLCVVDGMHTRVELAAALGVEADLTTRRLSPPDGRRSGHGCWNGSAGSGHS